MDKTRVIVLRGRETDPAIFKYCKSLQNHGYEVKLLIWNRRNNAITEQSPFSICQFFFRAPLDKTSAVLFYPVWWFYIVLFLIRERPDIVHACDFDTMVPTLLSKNLIKFSFVYTIFDFYANNIQEGKFPGIRTRIKKFVKAVDFWGIGSSDLLILADESRFEEIQGASVKNLIYIYNTPEDIGNTEIKPIPVQRSNITVFFAGLLMHFRGITDIIKAVQDLPNVELILAGSLIDADIMDTIEKYPECTKYIGWIPSYHEVLERTLNSDILIRLSDPKHPKTRYESPNKLFEAMMCGKPIIVSDMSAMAAIVRKTSCGLVVPYGDIDAIKEAIRKLAVSPDLRKEFGTNGRNSYDQTYSWLLMEQRLLTAYDDIRGPSER